MILNPDYQDNRGESFEFTGSWLDLPLDTFLQFQYGEVLETVRLHAVYTFKFAV